MKDLKISFKYLSQDFDINDNIFLFILKKRYNVIINNYNYDYLFTGDRNYIDKNALNIWFSGEPTWDKQNCNWGLVQYDIYNKENYIRFPLYLYYCYDYIKRGDIKDFNFFFKNRFFTKENLKEKTKFCNFICGGPSQGNGQYRDHFVQKLMKYKKIDCPGSRYNNMSRLPGDSSNGLLASSIKRKFIKDYKFTLGFENNSTRDGYNGYTTEKLVDPLVSNSLLIYWGNIEIKKEFNTNSFINFHDYNNEDDVISKIIEVDNNDDLYIDIMNNTYTYNNDYLNVDYLVSLMEKIFN